ncbi:MAG: LPXTG cell wall anchor domain-containing protein [Ilumatobacteraceae bacterium]
MKKVNVLTATVVAVLGALSVGSAAFASGGCDQSWGCDSLPDTVPVTVPTTTAAPTTEAPTTAAPTTEASTTSAAPTSAAPTSEAGGGVVTVSTEEVGQEAPTTTTRRGSDGLLPNTGTDIAIPLVLAGLAAGTGAATLLVRRRTNVG